MKIPSWFVILLSLAPIASFASIASSLASSLPQALVSSLADAKSSYVSYSKKSASEIAEHISDDSDVLLLGQLDLSDVLESGYSDDETLAYRIQTVKDLASTFSDAQLEALPKAVKHAATQYNNDEDLTKRSLAYVNLARLFKKNKLKDEDLKMALNQLPFKYPAISAGNGE